LAEAIRFAMIGGARSDIRKRPSGEVYMTTSNVIEFARTNRPMTYEEGFAFIERTRRQLDRFDVALPGRTGARMDPKIEARIREICDELEAEFKSDLGII